MPHPSDERPSTVIRELAARASVVDLAAAAYAALFFAWLFLRTPGTAATEAIGAAAFYPLGLAVAWACWTNSRLPVLDAPTRRAWRLFAFAALALWVAGNAGDVLSRLAGRTLDLAWVGPLRVIHAVLLLAGCLALPSRPFGGRSRLRAWLDAALVVFAGLAAALYLGLRVWDRLPRMASSPTLLVEHVLDCAVFAIAAVGSVRQREAGGRAALMFWSLAITAYVGANYLLVAGVTSSPGAAYRPGDALDGMWFAAWVFRWLAARVARALYERERPPRSASSGEDSSEYESSRFSYLVVAGVFLLLIERIFSGDRQFLVVLALSAATMFVLLVLRQVVELRENRFLFEQQLAQEARFRSLVQRSSDITLIVDTRGVIAYASPAVAEALGDRSPVRAGIRLADAVREDDRLAVALVVASGRGPKRLAFHLPAAPDDWREIEALWSDLRNDPAVGGVVFNCRDVTARSEIARQLRHTQRLDAIGRLADGLAHDVNNSLTVIRGVADLLEAEIPPGAPASEDLAHIRQAVDRAGALTRRVLAFSRRQPTRQVVFDLNALVQDLFSVIRQAATPKVQVRLTLAIDLWAVRADPGQIEQVLVNLATNARDAMPDGGDLDIVTANRRVEVSSQDAPGVPPGDYASMAVVDSGVGMTPDVLARIFEPFFSTKSHGAGTGLGLAMVRDIVREAGGHVLVRSAPGEGSSFTVLLPRTLEAVATVEKAAPPATDPVHAHMVLLVDDEAPVRTVTRRILERHGYGVIEADGGREAMTLIDDPAVAFDVLLTDLVMPDIHGRELVTRCGERRPSVPVLCMSGFAGDCEDFECCGDNLVEILSKPFTADRLARAIAAALERRGRL
jgi:PAS domain S-box-containing protein